MDGSDLLWILLLTFTSISCQIEIERRHFKYYSNADYFSYSNDYFTNPSEGEDFCTARNAECKNRHDCSRCYCGNKEKTFLSYQQGCLNYSTANAALQASECMRISTTIQNIIPSIFDYNLQRYRYYNIYMPNAVTGTAGKCTPTKLTAYDMKYGHGSSFNQKTLSKFTITKTYSNFQLKCNSKTGLQGHLLRLSINCTVTGDQKNKYVNTCLIFVMNGKYVSNEETKTTATPVIPTVKKGVLYVERHAKRSGDFYQSSDVFTNPDHRQEFCAVFRASCYEYCGTDEVLCNCNKCRCIDDRDTFVSYRDGCLNGKTANETLGLKSCLNIQGHTDGINFIQQQTFQYGTCIKLLLPFNLRGNLKKWSCVVNSMKSINALTGEEELSAENPFYVNVSRVFNNHLCLQCKSFTCDLSMYSGMLLKLGIKCRNKNLSQSFNTCFAFSMDGILAFNETAEKEATDKSYKKGSIEVERKLESPGTRDYYTNPEKHKDFCWERKSLCTSESECSKCRCLFEFSTFVSYKNGCMNITKYRQQYEIRNCLHSDKHLVVSSDFKHKRCVYLEKPPDLMKDDWSCVVNKMSYINPINGQEENLAMTVPFRISTLKMIGRKDKFCLQCDYFSCKLSVLSGRLLKLGIHCVLNETKSRELCIAFKMGGMYAVNDSFVSDVMKKPLASKSEGMDSSLIVVVVLCVLAISISVTAFIFVWRKTRTQKKNTSCAHNIVGESRSNIELEMTDVNPSQEYASLGACTSNQTPDVKNTIIQNEDHLYNKLAERCIPNSSMYSAMKVDGDSPPEYSVLEDAYTKVQNPIAPSEVAGAEDIYTEDDIYSVANNPTRFKASKYTNVLTTADDGVDNPYYGIKVNSPDYLCVDNGFSQDNSFHGKASSVPSNEGLTEDNEYAVVMKENKPKRMNPAMNVEEQQEHEVYEPNEYYQVGDSISSR